MIRTPSVRKPAPLGKGGQAKVKAGGCAWWSKEGAGMGAGKAASAMLRGRGRWIGEGLGCLRVLGD